MVHHQLLIYLLNHDHKLTDLYKLQKFNDTTYYKEHATSLRMSDLGYKNASQDVIRIDYNSLHGYTSSLKRALYIPSPEYQKFDNDVDIKSTNANEWNQLSSNLLQIENEFYAFMRPKRVTKKGSPLVALSQKGVEYIELRAIDCSPYDINGISTIDLRFYEALCMFCVLLPSESIHATDIMENNTNQSNVANYGLHPSLELVKNSSLYSLKDTLYQILTAMTPICQQLDIETKSNLYMESLHLQFQKIQQPKIYNPAYKILSKMNNSHHLYGLNIAKNFATQWQDQTIQNIDFWHQLAINSIQKQKEEEQNDQINFKQYVDQYYQQYNLI